MHLSQHEFKKRECIPEILVVCFGRIWNEKIGFSGVILGTAEDVAQLLCLTMKEDIPHAADTHAQVSSSLYTGS